MAASLRDKAIKDDSADEILKSLTTEVGTHAYAKAREANDNPLNSKQVVKWVSEFVLL
ncbi:hypothetical protein [Paraglaciecola sp.]|uniref:hypothetical protein n=1 Tax=Paraglaciecola sp. TaxID=1920173 RepID=UPI0030F3C8FE